MHINAKRLLVVVLLLVIFGGCAVTVGLWRVLAGAVGGPVVQEQESAPVMEGEAIATPTLAAVSAQGTGTVPPPTALAIEAAAGNALTGTYEGTIRGDAGSTAELRLELVQQGTAVAGTAIIGAGLQIDAGGFCGSFPVPATRLQTDEQLDSPGSRHFSSTSTVSVEGFEIPVVLEATLSEDGQTIVAAATLETPALCANDPTISGTLARVGG